MFLGIFFTNFLFGFLSIIISAEQFIVPPAGLPNQGLLKEAQCKISFLRKELPESCSSCELIKAIEDNGLQKL